MSAPGFDVQILLEALVILGASVSVLACGLVSEPSVGAVSTLGIVMTGAGLCDLYRAWR